MGHKYKTVEGETGAVNVLTEITTFGAITAVGPIKVPENARLLRRLLYAVGVHNDTAGDQGVILLRLTGDGINKAPQDFVLCGAGSGVTMVGAPSDGALREIVVDLEVTPNETITVSISAAGDDVLIATAAITFDFET